MKLFSTALCIALCAATSGFAAVPPVPDYQPIPGVSAQPITEGAGLKGADDLEKFFDEIMPSQLKHAPGATVSLVKDGKVIFIKGYGYADLEKKIPVDPATTLFRPGSISKLFTATAAMQLVEQGKLDLDVDVNQYLTQFQLPATFPQPVTLRNIMTHSSGFESFVGGAQWKRTAADLEPLGQQLKRFMPGRVNPPVTDFAAGRVAAYCNWCVALEGLIVANVSGMDYDEYQEKHIFAPLGMTRSTFREPLPAALAGDMAVGYSYENGKFVPHDFEFIHGIGPAGNLSSTATDMANFMIAHLGNGAFGETRILSDDSAQQMHRRQVSPNPYLPGAGLQFSETYINGRRLIGHPGGTRFFSSRLLLLPEENLGLFVSYNSSGGEGGGSKDLIQAFMDRYYPAKLPKLTPPADFAERAGLYAGSYLTYVQSLTTNEKVLDLLGNATYKAPGDGTLVLGDEHWIEVKPDVFRNRDSEAMLAFAEGDDGRMHALVHPFVAMFKLRWYETSLFHYFVLGFGALCFVIAIVSALWNWKADRLAAPAPRKARRLAALLAAMQLLFVVLIAVVFTGEWVFGFPPLLYWALALPLLAIPLTAALLYFAVRSWRENFWTRYARIQYSVIALGSLAFLWSLNYWNLVGYKLS